MAKDDALKTARAVSEAFELSLSWLSVWTDPDGHTKRFGPFGSHDEAEEYGRERFDYQVTVEEMHDVRVFEDRMYRDMREHAERYNYERAMKNA